MTSLTNDGYPVELVILSDTNATDFVGLARVPIFRDPSPGRLAWSMMIAGAVKHDTFVYSKTGERVYLWDASAQDLSKWSADIRAAVVAQGL